MGEQNSLTQIEKRNIVVNLIGYGFPDSNLWIMGYEESKMGEWKTETTDAEFSEFRNGFTNDMMISYLHNSSYRKTYGGYYRLIKEIFPEYSNEDSEFFVLNLLPFGKANCKTILSPDICEIFGAESHKELYDSTIDARHNALIDFFERYNWKDKNIVFCIGNMNGKEEELKLFLSRLYNVDKEKLFINIFQKYNRNSGNTENKKEDIYLYWDNDLKKFITYQASSGTHIDKAIKIIKDIKRRQ